MAQKQAGYGRRQRAARHESFLRHAGFRWLKLSLVLSIAVAAGFLLQTGTPGVGLALHHTGSSWFGYASGTIGALLILWLTLLGLRKRAITDGNWSLKAWVSAHVYLGLSLLVIVTLHTGFQFGWNVHTFAYVLMLLVIASGIFGVIMYVRLPRRLSENRGETTQKQMLEIIRGLDSRLLDAAQPLDQGPAALVRASIERTRIGGSFWRRVTNLHGNCATREARRKLTAIRQKQSGDTGPLDQALSLLEQKSLTLEQARRHIRLRALLEMWLYVHVPATLALIAALTAHIVSVFFYW